MTESDVVQHTTVGQSGGTFTSHITSPSLTIKEDDRSENVIGIMERRRSVLDVLQEPRCS